MSRRVLRYKFNPALFSPDYFDTAQTPVCWLGRISKYWDADKVTEEDDDSESDAS